MNKKTHHWPPPYMMMRKQKNRENGERERLLMKAEKES